MQISLTIDAKLQDAIGFSPDAKFTVAADGSMVNKKNPFAVGVRNKSDDDDEEVEIAIYGEVGNPWEATDSRSVAAFLRANKGKRATVRINSLGGSAYDGIAIHNALAAHDAPVTTVIEGMAGSAASVIAVGGHHVQIMENAHFFIHEAALIAAGRKSVLDEGSAWLAKVNDAIARTYKAKTGKALDKLLSLMHGNEDGTMFTAAEALADRFVDEVVSIRPLKKAAKAMAGLVAVPEQHAEEVVHYVEAYKAARLRSRSEFSFLHE